MKLLLSSLLILSVLVIGVSSAEAYEGKIDSTIGLRNVDYYIGDIVPVNGFIFRAEPIPGEIMQIRILDVNGIVIHTGETMIDSEMFLLEGVEEVWKFQYLINTSEFEGNVQYTLETQYDDKMDLRTFSVSIPLDEQLIMSGQAMQEGKLIINPDEPQSEITVQTSIPQWVDNIFIMYAEKQITQSELINALQYLIKIKILQV